MKVCCPEYDQPVFVREENPGSVIHFSAIKQETVFQHVSIQNQMAK